MMYAPENQNSNERESAAQMLRKARETIRALIVLAADAYEIVGEKTTITHPDISKARETLIEIDEAIAADITATKDEH